ncbi:hypothetical protein SAMN05216489_02442 [Streptomyces sp. 3213]|uniref:hypothetical protein n=1 Tax=Streptomyces sp. 3213.3 TaxID=1855348 RepID=UPI000897E544|nr:hypothetical protein [Streptomyces sp. 3213.3]SED07515.1 hypothetical protein SAMN05216489_02442 [Streptomyces sp. 3213] [Streptomyces sp. 3213.3]
MAAAWGRGSAETDEWLEVYGEAEPQSIPLERIFATGTDKATPFTGYLYVWTLGYIGDAPSVKVTLLFPAVGGWRVKDVQAIVYHLPPVADERAWRATLARDMRSAAPVLEAAGKLTADLVGFPELNAITSAAAHMRARSAPQMQNEEWYVKRVHRSPAGILHQGVEWTLPANFVKQIGTRVTGALLVQFVGAAPASEDTDPSGSEPLPILACATLTRGKEVRLPQDDYVRLPLRVTPERPRT